MIFLSNASRQTLLRVMPGCNFSCCLVEFFFPLRGGQIEPGLWESHRSEIFLSSSIAFGSRGRARFTLSAIGVYSPFWAVGLIVYWSLLVSRRARGPYDFCS